jgi:purine-binding chemotaxis protein CheW
MTTQLRKIVTFRLGDDLFGVEVAQVERVLRHRAPTPLPDSPDWLVGVMEHGGRVVPVVDMRRRMSLPSVRARFQTRIVVLLTSAGPVGVVVDAVHEVARINDGDVEPPPALYRGISAEFIRGLVRRDERIVIVLDADRVLTTADRIVLDAALSQAAPS